MNRNLSLTICFLLVFLGFSVRETAAQAPRFTVVPPESLGIDYVRGASPTEAIAEAFRQQGTGPTLPLLIGHPLKSLGASGVALLDYDSDGDLDIYVTNGPGHSNNLFANQLADGEFGFVEVPGAAGADATEQDSTGVCFGDIDNDGDPDLVTLGRNEPKRLYENLGGWFVDISHRSGSDLAASSRNSSSCAMGDLDGDGRLDLFVGNTMDWSTKRAIFVEPFALNEPNQIYLNRGNNRFKDVSATAGILGSVNDISWSVSIWDYDADGDLDIFVANDQGAIPLARYGGVDRGFIRVLQNDGKARFRDVTAAIGQEIPGGWMGFAVADYDSDGTVDMFVSSVGDWIEPFVGLPYNTRDQSTRWFLNRGDGTFRDPGIGALNATPWAWGTTMLDADNDGDFDVASLGGLDAGIMVERSNPGTLYLNDGQANFTFAAEALPSSIFLRRNEHGVASGDLNGDGFEDIVSVSDANAPPGMPLAPYGFTYGSPFDSLASFWPIWAPTGNGDELVWTGLAPVHGTLAISLSQGGNGNGWVDVDVFGTKGLAGGKNNRSGYGAIVRSTPEGATRAASQPILGGSSQASQDSTTAHFGLGLAEKTTIEVVWPGGVRNRLYDVEAGERVRFPEIPCNFAENQSFGRYNSCVRNALRDLVRAGALSPAEQNRFAASAVRAFNER